MYLGVLDDGAVKGLQLISQQVAKLVVCVVGDSGVVPLGDPSRV